ncbi:MULTISPECIES: hypothetical protein [unclassified Thiocapsa]|uniref:hypothetical protein n=1 Tax=unclassified Thiocapsa TaxID=2641286 RepID=UPI0035B04CCA
MLLSIDQNSNSLWDTLPKLHALSWNGYKVRHGIQDTDLAFTASGASVGEPPRLVAESWHPHGGQDWGAALFYSGFLGRSAIDPASWSRYLGMGLGELARSLGCGREELYWSVSPGETWMLVGASDIGDGLHHRTLGDLRASEVAPPLRALLRIAEQDCVRAFPSPVARRRARRWFAAELELIERLQNVVGQGSLVRLYQHWLAHHLNGAVSIGRASALVPLAEPSQTALLECFVRDYDQAGALYNQAVAETETGLHPLRLRQGELPFFVGQVVCGREVRSAVFLRNGRLCFADRELPLARNGRLPLDALSAAEVRYLAGKAALFALQVRVGATAHPLALPHRGSSYLPTTHRLHQLLANSGLWRDFCQPILRVRLHFLSHLSGCRTPVHLPEALATVLGRDWMPAGELAACVKPIAEEARQQLQAMTDPSERSAWLTRSFSTLTAEIGAIARQRRESARAGAAAADLRALWEQERDLTRRRLSAWLERVMLHQQLSKLDDWDSRGALLPWAVALGGKTFYWRMIRSARIQVEPSPLAPGMPSRP